MRPRPSIELVREFHQVFGHPIADKPTIIDKGTLDFRTNFIIEELKELAEAVAEGNIVNVADALGDIQYVLDGAFLNAGLHDKKDRILDAIHDSNLSKACRTQEEAEATMKSLEGTFETYWEKIGDYYVVKRKGDGKVMKGIGYHLPDLDFVKDGGES